MEPRHRRISIALFGLALAGWAAVAVIGIAVDPRSSSGAGFAGAGALGLATGMTAAPLFWLVGFARQRRIAYRGDWTRAIRRGAWVGVLVAVFVVMRLNGIFQPQIALFLLALALVAEITLSSGGPGRS
jgi:hypothetical protein